KVGADPLNVRAGRFGLSYYFVRSSSKGFGFGFGGNRGRFAPPDRVLVGFLIGYPIAVFAVRVRDIAGRVPPLVVAANARLVLGCALGGSYGGRGLEAAPVVEAPPLLTLMLAGQP